MPKPKIRRPIEKVMEGDIKDLPNKADTIEDRPSFAKIRFFCEDSNDEKRCTVQCSYCKFQEERR